MHDWNAAILHPYRKDNRFELSIPPPHVLIYSPPLKLRVLIYWQYFLYTYDTAGTKVSQVIEDLKWNDNLMEKEWIVTHYRFLRLLEIWRKSLVQMQWRQMFLVKQSPIEMFHFFLKSTSQRMHVLSNSTILVKLRSKNIKTMGNQEFLRAMPTIIWWKPATPSLNYQRLM